MLQVRIYFKWNCLQHLFGKLQISDKLVLEELENQAGEYKILACIATEDKPTFFNDAISYFEFFILICALKDIIIDNFQIGTATEISNINELGKLPFPNYEISDVLPPPPELIKPILLAKERFLELENDRQKIMKNYLGIAIPYYYYAVRSFTGTYKRVEETIIDLAISAEALFIQKKMGISKNLKQRLSNFIAIDESERIEIKKRIGEFYKLRCDIVHGRGLKKNTRLAEVIIPKDYIRRAIDKALSSKLYEKKDLIKRIDSISVT